MAPAPGDCGPDTGGSGRPTRRGFAATLLAASVAAGTARATPIIPPSPLPFSLLPSWTPSDGTLQVSQLLALTGAGALAGDAFRNGVEMAVQEINTTGGLLGRMVEIFTYNTASSPQGALAAAPRALEGRPLALLGPVAAAETRAVAPIARAHRLMQIAAAGAPAPGEPMLLLTEPDQAARMVILARWLQAKLGVRRLATLSAGGMRHDAAAERLASACRALGLEMVADMSVPPGAESADAKLAWIARQRADALFVAASGRAAVRILQDAARLAPGVALVGQAGLIAPEVLAAAGPAAQGVRALLSLTPDAPVPALEDFRARFQARYHARPTPW